MSGPWPLRSDAPRSRRPASRRPSRGPRRIWQLQRRGRVSDRDLRRGGPSVADATPTAPPLPRQLAGSVHAGIVLIFGAIRVLRRPRAARMVVPSMAIAMTRAHLLTRVSILIPATGTVHYECQR